ncbi:MAG TPA: PKD domain-containing protein, partial [Candidatus Dormibacteraeota bacterium]|nr:PKD domain-containing protein [Candidatus Dormibacteraeota bacterium]
ADPDVTQARVAVSIDSHQWSNSVIGNVLGSSGTHAPFRAVLPNVNFSWSNTAPQNFTYDSGLRNFAYTENVVFRLGYPFSGNNGAAGATADGTTNHLNYIDLLVRSNTVIHGNWDYSSKSIKYDPTIADHAVPASYYLTGKPTWFGSLQWPPFDPGNPSLCDLTNLPAGYRFIFGVDPPAGVLNKKPVAVMNAAPPKGTAPLTVSFSSAGSFDPEGVMLTYLWVFGDGSTSTVPNPTHTFLSSSNYLIRLIISDGTNTTTASNLTINVSMLDPKKSAETELKQVVRRTMLERDGFLANNECPSDTIAEPSAVFSRSFAASRLRRRNAWG